MPYRKLSFVLLTVAVILTGLIIFKLTSKMEVSGPDKVEPTVEELSVEQQVELNRKGLVVDSFNPLDKVESPQKLEGKIKVAGDSPKTYTAFVVDDNLLILGKGNVEIAGETDIKDFYGDIAFTKSTSEEGYIILESYEENEGIPNIQEYKIRIKFSDYEELVPNEESPEGLVNNDSQVAGADTVYN